jgi:3-hydroxybutyryl-CoA dehydrogenase
MSIEEKAIAIIGTGQMGRQLALFLIQKDYRVIVKSRRSQARTEILESSTRLLTRIHGSERASQMLRNLSVASDFGDIGECPLIFEAVIEDYEVKQRVLSDASRAASEDAIIATNTSSLSINRLSRYVQGPERFIGVHFFNPVHKMKLVELVKGMRTDPKVVEKVMSLMIELEKDPVTVADMPGFIVNRLLLPFINEGAILVEKGVLPKDVDKAVRLGLNHPMGPLEIADLIGLDTCVSILKTLQEELGDERYTPAPLMLQLIEQGKLGRKSCQGFYSYKDK